MEIQQLRFLVAIAEHGTFTHAAAALYVTQPTLSHAISKLESEVRLPLFHRGSGGVRLTSAGEALLGPARQALAALDDVHAAVDAVHEVTTGALRLVAVRTFTAATVEVVSAFHTAFPHVTVQISAPEPDDGVFDLISSGRCEVGFARVGATLPAGIQAQPVAEQKMYALFPDGLAPDGGEPMTLAEVARLPLIVPPAGTPARIHLERIFAEDGLTIQVAAENAHHESILAMVRAGFGVCVTTIGGARDDDRDVHSRRLLAPTRRSVVGLVWGRAPLSPAAQAFQSFVRDHFAPQVELFSEGHHEG